MKFIYIYYLCAFKITFDIKAQTIQGQVFN